jgi:ABC-type lipoprotein release transport system permease subunit
MVKIALKIAWRYLFAQKQFNAIHIITTISSIAVGVVTAAMICVLSVMNGFSVMIEQLFSQFDPDIRITAKVV